MFLYPNHAPRLLPALVAALALAAGAAAAPLTPQEQAGKKVYEEGVSP